MDLLVCQHSGAVSFLEKYIEIPETRSPSVQLYSAETPPRDKKRRSPTLWHAKNKIWRQAFNTENHLPSAGLAGEHILLLSMLNVDVKA